ncbi:uncharacterized protein LOC62_01G000578 [Vanrija pseudolonga]|uniref:Uncharacterized protein n=1 Tax=Vanrija pseudolonga TaxID=143232 RepID=A0AAF0XZR3_9TREE|nr:hypothetical protein LOC62_01G000578 [Vanrija pseudolonga]
MDQPIQAHLPNAELRAPPPQHVPASRSTSETHFALQHHRPSNATTPASDVYQPHRKLGIPWWKPWEKLQTPAVPDPWILRKQVVGIVLGLSAWAFYVGVARVCAPAIREWPNAGFSRAAGIGTLVAFVVLWLMFMWSYIVGLLPILQRRTPLVQNGFPGQFLLFQQAHDTVGIATSSSLRGLITVGTVPVAFFSLITTACGSANVFLTFNFWAGLFCLYNTILLIVHTVKTPKIDAQQVALIAISGFLFIFTLGMLFPTHVVLILSGKSTIESFQDNGQRQRENAALAEHLGGNCNVRERRGVIKQWDAEWGGVNPTDRWAFGTKSQMWKREMGDKWIGWILPIGKPQGDGVHFESNPRFGPNGEWLPKQHWPKVVAI